MEELKRIDYLLGMANRRVRLISRLNPTNARREKQKFIRAYFEGETYNPLFHYKKLTCNSRKLAAQLNALQIPVPNTQGIENYFAKSLEHKRRRILKKIACTEAIGTQEFAPLARELFGVPSTRQIHWAQGSLSNLKNKNKIPQDNIKILDAQQASIIFRQYFQNSPLASRWGVKITDRICAKAGINSKLGVVLINKKEQFTPNEAINLIAHEIETHIFRKENGLIQDLPHLFSGGFGGPPTTEEGLAFFGETKTKPDPQRLAIICARTLAAQKAQHGSFYDVFRALDELNLPPDLAWTIALRAKRGLQDTSQKGGFPKDHHYLKGYLAVKNFVEQGNDVKLLYTGKISIKQLARFSNLGIKLKEPQYLPQWINPYAHSSPRTIKVQARIHDPQN